jgi:hypothetical protein
MSTVLCCHCYVSVVFKKRCITCSYAYCRKCAKICIVNKKCKLCRNDVTFIDQVVYYESLVGNVLSLTVKNHHFHL